jgi:hypothetical protein
MTFRRASLLLPLVSFSALSAFTALGANALAAPKEPAPKSQDPFAPDAPPAAPGPSLDEIEEAALAPPTTPPKPPASAPRATITVPPSGTAGAARAGQRTDEVDGVPVRESSQAGFVLELATNSFASGSLHGGLFAGGRTAGGLIVGGAIDYGSSSVEVTAGGMSRSTSVSTFRLGAGLRYAFLSSADRRVDLFGAADLAAVFRSAENVAPDGSQAPTQSATGATLALGPGLRLWVHDQLAVGYVARLRLDYLSGEVGALTTPPSAESDSASATSIGFDGVFQLLGVF